LTKCPVGLVLSQALGRVRVHPLENTDVVITVSKGIEKKAGTVTRIIKTGKANHETDMAKETEKETVNETDTAKEIDIEIGREKAKGEEAEIARLLLKDESFLRASNPSRNRIISRRAMSLGSG
jgi:hypothetical protein